MEWLRLRIDGMHCGACVRRVTQALHSVQGVEVQEVRIGAASMQVEDAPAAEPVVLASITKAGYSAHVEK